MYLEFIGFLGLLLFFFIYSWLFKCICKGCEEFFFVGYNLYLFSCCYCCISYIFLFYIGKVFFIIVYVLYCILFLIYLYNKNVWFVFLLFICFVLVSYKNILFVILVIKNCREYILFFSGCFVFWECCYLKYWVMLIFKFFWWVFM